MVDLIIIGFACIIDRSNKSSLKIKNKPLVSELKIEAKTFKKNKIPTYLKEIPISSPGSRRI